MAGVKRPASLVPGWRGAWAYNVRPALVAIRDRGPLTLEQIAAVLYERALHADLTSGHDLGPLAGARALATAILEDAADIVVEVDGRYCLAADVREFVSPYTGETLALLSSDESDALAAADRAEKPVRQWASKSVYSPFGGKWVEGRLPHRNYGPDDVDEMAQIVDRLGWQFGARIVRDQNGVTIDGHLRADALRSLSIDPDIGIDPRSGEPYVEIHSFANDAARLHFALTANWATLKAPTREAIARQVLGLNKAADLTLEAVAALIEPVATRGAGGLVAADIDTVTDVAAPIDDDDEVVLHTLTDEDGRFLAMLGNARAEGSTSYEIGGEHQKTSARLVRLERAGLIFRLKGVDRGGYSPYVLKEWVQGRPVHRQRRSRRRSPAPPSAPAVPESTWSNRDLAAMPFDRAFTGLSFNNQKARVSVYSGIDHNRPVAEHVAPIVADFNAKCPGLLDLMCDYRAATRRS